MEQENAFNYDKGVLAEILEPIMGKGLIPADLETWKPRRRAIVPAFHKAYLDAMVAMFGRCTHETIRSLDTLTASNSLVTTCNASLQSGLIQEHAVFVCFAACGSGAGMTARRPLCCHCFCPCLPGALWSDTMSPAELRYGMSS